MQEPAIPEQEEGGEVMGGKASRRKGHQWERDVANRFREVLPGLDIKRGFQTRGGGAEEADVEGIPFLHIECKVGKMPNPRAALKQATDDAKPGRAPIGVIKDDRQEPFVVLSLDDFLDFIKEWWVAGNNP